MNADRTSRSGPSGATVDEHADRAPLRRFQNRLDELAAGASPWSTVAHGLRELTGASEVAVLRVVDGHLQPIAQASAAGAPAGTPRPLDLGDLALRLDRRVLREGHEEAHDALAVPIRAAGDWRGVLTCAAPALDGDRVDAFVDASARVVAHLERAVRGDGPGAGPAAVSELTAAERERRLDALGDLAGGIAHDFNNALTSILGNVSLARLHGGVSRAVDGLLASAEESCLRARRLTRQLLTFAGGGEPIQRPVDLAVLVAEVVDDVSGDREQSIALAVGADLPPAFVDEDQVRQAVSYLLEHALSVTAVGGEIALRLQRREGAGEPELLLEHNGRGFTEDELQRIFDPFADNVTGAPGLGLSVAHSIVRRHGGRITATSAHAGRGAMFRIVLPAAEDAGRERPQARVADPAGDAGRRVLVMDDDDAVRTSLMRMIRHLGHEVGGAADGRQALDAWQEAAAAGHPFDLIVMDLTVPHGMGGREAIRELLALDPGARAVVASGYSKDPIMANYRAHGFVDVLEKPCELRSIRAVLERVLRGDPAAER